ncbi:hypothetical protein STEG23_019184 [Scotinomys teguina]
MHEPGEQGTERAVTELKERMVTMTRDRIFPVLNVNVSGLDPTVMGSFLLDCVVADNHREKRRNGKGVLEDQFNLQIPKV